MNREVIKLCDAVRAAGGRAMVVGGSVRDQLLGIESKDFDVEVYGLDPARLREVLERIGRVNTVGEHFSVYKLSFCRSTETQATKDLLQQNFEIDVSLPRRESKSGSGHRGFVIEGDPEMSFEEAARRRDFTINAILYDPLTEDIVDPYGGRGDLKRRVLRAVDAGTFVEDSLRVLRAVQLAARFEMTIEPETAELCRNIDLTDLPHERVWGEVEKLLMLAERPSIGLNVARELGVLDKLFPEIHALAGHDQLDRAYVEAEAFDHTRRALDQAVTLAVGLARPQRIAVLLATLCHKLGVPAEELDSGELVLRATRSVLEKLGVQNIGGYDVRSQVLALVCEHRKPREFYLRRETTTEGEFRRLAQTVDLDLLYRVAKACATAQNLTPPIAEDWFIEKARSVGVEHGPPAPLLLGRHLVEAGVEPGPQMGRLLREVYELQLDGEVTTVEEGLAVALGEIPRPPKLFR